MPRHLRKYDVLVKIHAASLNARDLVLVKVNLCAARRYACTKAPKPSLLTAC